MSPRLTPKGEKFSALTVEVFRTRALRLQGAESLAQSVGLTSAKWQILGMLANSPATVASVARMVGLTRQSVQQTADAMEAEGLITFAENPHHRRAQLMEPTAAARAALAKLRPREIDFANLMGRPHTLEALDAALAVLRRTREALEAGIREQQR